jgi:threonine synthase
VCPSAVGGDGLRDPSEVEGSPAVVVLSTAHPAKFGSAIREELGFVPALPDAYSDWANRPLLAQTLDDPSYDAFRAWLVTRD